MYYHNMKVIYFAISTKIYIYIYHRPISTVTKMTAKKNIAFNATNFHIAIIYMYIAIW